MNPTVMVLVAGSNPGTAAKVLVLDDESGGAEFWTAQDVSASVVTPAAMTATAFSKRCAPMVFLSGCLIAGWMLKEQDRCS
jgi:hypothetical protein